MRKIIVALIIIGLLIATPVFAQEKRTRQYTPVLRQGSYTLGPANMTIWTPSAYDSIVLDSYTISSNSAGLVTLAASSTIVSVIVTASEPVVSPGGFLWKGNPGETIYITGASRLEVTLTGWEEDN